MLQVARLSPRLLGESGQLVADFLRGQLNDDGGFADRAGVSDLYYTVFGMEGLIALRADLPAAKIETFLKSFGEGEGLDFVHLACLARCWANLPGGTVEHALRHAIAARIEALRTSDGGYNPIRNAKSGTLYACFLATGAYQDLKLEMPRAGAMLECIDALEAADGGFANQRDVPMGLTAPTAAAVTLLRHLGQPERPRVGEWLLSRHRPEGGFFATPMAPMPDLLSTATALHALSSMHVDITRIKEACLDFVDTLWTSRGGFYGNWSDEVLDCEYTYYGLLALGHLSL